MPFEVPGLKTNLTSGLSAEFLEEVKSGQAPILRYPLTDGQQPYGATIEFVVDRIITETFMGEEEIVRTDDVIVPDTNVYVSSTPAQRALTKAMMPAIMGVRGGLPRAAAQDIQDKIEVIENGVPQWSFVKAGTGWKGKKPDQGETKINQINLVSQVKHRRQIDESTRISLYLPAGLVFNDGVTYDNVNIGMMGLAAERDMQSDRGAVESVAALGDTIAQLVKGQAGKEMARIVQQGAASKISEGIGGGMSGALRVKANPHTRVLFGSVPVRTFEFAFTFLPTSLKEAEAVHNIIKSFRTELYPMGIAEADNTFFGYRYPDTYQIKFLYNDDEIKNAPKIINCYLQSVNTNYNPNEMAFYKLKKPTTVNGEEGEGDGDVKFSEITMSLSFIEERTLFKQDVEAHYRGERR